MSKSATVFGLALVLLFCLTSSARAQELTAEKTTFDFGRIREGTNAKVSFTIANRGSRKAQLLEIRTFAACVEAHPQKNRFLARGERITLNFIFESLGYGGAEVNKQVEVHYNNTRLSPLKLTVRGEVLPLEPHQAPLGELTYNFSVLVDIRPEESFLKEHIIGAINVPYPKIAGWAEEVSKSISGELIIYLCCEDGSLSDQAAKRLRERGSKQFISLVGGLEEWKKQLGSKFLISGKS